MKRKGRDLVGLTENILLKDRHDRAKELGLELGEGRRGAVGDESDEGRERLERVLVESRVRRVPADLADDADEPLENGEVNRGEGLAGRKDDTHDAAHEVVILSYLLGCLTALDVGEEGHEDVLGEGADVGLGEAAEGKGRRQHQSWPARGCVPATHRAWPFCLMKRMRSIVVAAYE